MAEDRLRVVIAEVLEIDVAGVDNDAAMNVTPNWDSLKNVVIVMEIEKAFALSLAFDTFEQVTSLAGFRALLQRHGVALPPG